MKFTEYFLTWLIAGISVLFIFYFFGVITFSEAQEGVTFDLNGLPIESSTLSKQEIFLKNLESQNKIYNWDDVKNDSDIRGRLDEIILILKKTYSEKCGI